MTAAHAREIAIRDQRIAHLEAQLTYKTEIISTLLDKISRMKARHEPCNCWWCQKQRGRSQ